MNAFFGHIRAILALFAAILLAASGFCAPAAELSEELEHLALHAERITDQSPEGAGGAPAPGPQHPDTPGHAHCGPTCHVQSPDARLEIAVADPMSGASFAELTESLRPPAHLEGLFRPPRALRYRFRAERRRDLYCQFTEISVQPFHMRRALAPRSAASIAAGAFCLIAFGASGAASATEPMGGPSPVALSVDDAVARALKAAPMISASAQAIEAAEGAWRQAGARPNPLLTLEAEDFAGSGDYSGFGAGQYTYSLGQQIERGGKRGARRAVAAADRTIATFSAKRTELEVVFAARAAFIEAASAEVSLDVMKARVASLEETRKAVARRVNAARDPASALNAAAAAKAEADAALTRALRGRRQALEELALLTALASSTVSVTAPWFLTPPAPMADPHSEVRSADMAILASRETRAAAAADLERANAKQDPTISVGFRNLQASRDTAAVVSLSMPLGVFNRNKGAIARAEAERRQAAFEREAGALALSRDIVRAKGALDAASSEAAMLKRDVIPQAERALASARAGFQRGAFGYLDVAAAETAYFQYRVKEIDALKQAHLAKAAFDRLTAELPDRAEGDDE